MVEGTILRGHNTWCHEGSLEALGFYDDNWGGHDIKCHKLYMIIVGFKVIIEKVTTLGVMSSMLRSRMN